MCHPLMCFARRLFPPVWLVAGTLAGLLGVGAQAQAQPVAEAADTAAIYSNAQRWLDDALAGSASSLPLRMEVSVGELDRRLRLAPCDRVEPYIPPNVRLWGKSRLGLRCTQGSSKWNVFLPITVKAFGPAWVVKGLVQQGAVLSEDDAMAVEVDWAEFNSPIVANVSDWVGQTAVRMLSTGQALRQDMVRAAQVFQAGAQVRVLARGVGFEIATSGQAVSAGVVGHSARVRMDNGRIMTGEVLDSRTVGMVL
ncbi:MAG: flagellar basal body P-ring formation chaperone FlgA [Rhodoferax sp.]|uniref:flagellar basal body P-ring formation chaperone FlgA n=1 Tax=Rhodoferax sp. TaxID=50421 RepID=UPI002634E459|nr:flagellar basal body P-ring formation chaperone FlgA [Rhodoferax sp.]MDD2880942.1 flagellar basal body P-ring formation chaperone FlgA [Rhodoferax sp.]